MAQSGSPGHPARRWVAVLAAALGLAAVLGSRSLPGWRPLAAWMVAEAAPMAGHFGVTAGRLSQTIALALGLGAGAGVLMRTSERAEGWLTLWLLAALAAPWFPLLLLLNLLAGLTEGAGIGIGALVAAPRIAWAMRPLASGRAAGAEVRKGLRLAALAALLAEGLSRGDGLAAQVRFFFLFFSPPRLVAYVALLGVLWGAAEWAFAALGRALSRLVEHRLKRAVHRPL